MTSLNRGSRRAKASLERRCKWARTVGLMRVKRIPTGWPSKAPKSTCCSKKQTAIIGREMCKTIGLRTWGMAIPSPMPVDPKCLPGQQHLVEIAAIHFLRKTHDMHYRPQHRSLVRATNAVMHPARLQGLVEPGLRHVLLLGLMHDLRRYTGPGRGCPFQQFRTTETVLLVHAVNREFPLLDPTVYRLFGNVEKPGYISNTQLHGYCTFF